MSIDRQAIQHALEEVPHLYRGPGGAIAVVKDGELIGQHVWGYANMDTRTSMTASTQMPICSITKQMLCALLIDLERNPPPSMVAQGDVSKQLSDQLSRLLPHEITQETGLTVRHLCNNQSGIRDYWAMSVLWGARPDGQFTLESDAPRMREQITSFHFQPGSQYSYSNTNFHLLARSIESLTKESVGKLLAERIFSPAGMTTATLCENTAYYSQQCVGYEGDEKHGFLPALNRIEWSGDAGVVASLTDMIAYEKYLDRSWVDPQSLYRAIAKPQTFNDGTPARYGYGLAHNNVGDVALLGHGGALRGFRLHRLHAPRERLSVVVMLNHEAEAEGAAQYLLRQALNLPKPPPSSVVGTTDWIGTYFDPDNRLSIIVEQGGTGEILITYAGYPETLRLLDSSHAQSYNMTAVIDGSSLTIHRLKDNLVIHARRISGSLTSVQDSDYVGEYHCDEIGSSFRCSGKAHMLYGTFDGFLGSGPVHLMRYLGEDVWALACPRGMDAHAPGDWTVAFNRNEQGTVVGVTIGCWLARKLEFVKVL